MTKSLKARVSTLSPSCIRKVRELSYAEVTGDNAEIILHRIAREENSSRSAIHQLLKAFWASNWNAQIVTIFVNDQKWIAGKSDCFDWRHDTQIIPRNSWTIGLLCRGKTANVFAPDLNEARKEKLLEVIQDALEHLGAFMTTPEELLEKQSLPIEEF